MISQPRALLQAVCEDYAEMPDARECCGLGGTYGFSHPEISEQILAKKIKSISGMDRVPAKLATGCPGCIMQLTHGLNHGQIKMEVGHVVQYLCQALI